MIIHRRCRSAGRRPRQSCAPLSYSAHRHRRPARTAVELPTAPNGSVSTASAAARGFRPQQGDGPALPAPDDRPARRGLPPPLTAVVLRPGATMSGVVVSSSPSARRLWGRHASGNSSERTTSCHPYAPGGGAAGAEIASDEGSTPILSGDAIHSDERPAAGLFPRRLGNNKEHSSGVSSDDDGFDGTQPEDGGTDLSDGPDYAPDLGGDDDAREVDGFETTTEAASEMTDDAAASEPAGDRHHYEGADGDGNDNALGHPGRAYSSEDEAAEVFTAGKSARNKRSPTRTVGRPAEKVPRVDDAPRRRRNEIPASSRPRAPIDPEADGSNAATPELSFPDYYRYVPPALSGEDADRWEEDCRRLLASHMREFAPEAPIHRDLERALSLESDPSIFHKNVVNLRFLLDTCKTIAENSDFRKSVEKRPAKIRRRQSALLPILTQPVLLWGHMRMGKMSAIMACACIALQQGFNIVLLVGPNKHAPVQEAVRALKTAGFDEAGYGLSSTLSEADNKKLGLDRLPGRIYVGAVLNHSDLGAVSEYVSNSVRYHRVPVLVIVDEADILTTGHGGATSFNVAEIDSEVVEQVGRQNIAKCEEIFRERILPFSGQLLVTGTMTGVFVRTSGVFRYDLPGPRVILVPDRGTLAGMRHVVVPKDWNFDMSTASKNSEALFNDGMPGFKVLEMRARIGYEREQLTPCPGLEDAYPAILLNPSVFISTTVHVKVRGGINAQAPVIAGVMQRLADEAALEGGWEPERALLIAYVGSAPAAYYVDRSSGTTSVIRMKAGLPLEEMYDSACKKAGTQFSFLAFIGYSLTSRSMTPVFDRNGCLFVPSFGVLSFPKEIRVCVEGQRIARTHHDFGVYLMPQGYKICIAGDEHKIKMVVLASDMQEAGIRAQFEEPKDVRQFLEGFPVFEKGLKDALHSKLGKRLAQDLGREPLSASPKASQQE